MSTSLYIRIETDYPVSVLRQIAAAVVSKQPLVLDSSEVTDSGYLEDES